VAEVFAGFLCGYILALASSPLLAVTVLRLRTSYPVLERLLPEGTRAVSVIVVLHGGLIVFWTGIGIVLGLVLYAMNDDPESFLGSRNGAFTLLVAAFTLALSAPLAIVFARLRQAVVVAGVVAMVLFGWLMPYLARWSTFG